MIDINWHIHFDGIKVDLRNYLHIGMFLNMEYSMAENEENSFLTCNLVFVSYSFDKRGESEEQFNGNRLHNPRIDRWPIIANCDFPISFFQLHLECNREFNHHTPHLSGPLCQDSNVCLPLKFLFLGDFIHNHLNFKILYQPSDWRQNNFLLCLCNTIILFFFFY